jgi:hypothetical protein
MELKDFVSQTLTQICQGIDQARENTKGMKSLIAPRTGKENFVLRTQDEPGFAHSIHFEVLLVNQEGVESGGGLKVAGGLISLGGQTSSSDVATNTHKISFDVPLVWPELKRGCCS